MSGEHWWLWIVLGFLIIALLIFLWGRQKEVLPASMARPAAVEPENMPEGEEAVVADPPVSTQLPADRLEIIEGIGPKIALLLHEAGKQTFAQLAAADPAALKQVLTSARLSHLADPGTWPQQAALAAEARWDDLKELQQVLKGGHAV